jgi:hypothetical protein
LTRPPAASWREAGGVGFAVALGLGLGLVVLAAQLVLYLGHVGLLDHIEGSVVILGWQYAHGMPLYGLQDGAPRFASFYGPLAYLAPLPGLLLAELLRPPPDLVVAKLPFVLAPVLTLGLMAWHVRRAGAAAVAALFLLAGGLLLGAPVSYWLRPDPLETLLVAGAVTLCATPLAVVGVGVCLGLVVNLKVHAFLYVLPVLLDLWCRRGARAVVVAGLLSLVVFALPFLAPGISFADYRFGLAQQVGGRAPNPALLLTWFSWSALLAVPLLLSLTVPSPPESAVNASAADRRQVWAVLGVLALLAYPATFPGAGPYHLLPLLPVLADTYGRLRPCRPLARLAPFALLAAGLTQSALALVAIAGLGGLGAATREATRLADTVMPNEVQVGYGESWRGYQLSQLTRTVLALRGIPARIDAQVLLELHYVGIDGARRWWSLVGPCGLDVWLIPHDETPFAVPSFYYGYDGQPLFDAAFRAAFQAHYRRERSGVAFDLWRRVTPVADCPARSPEPPPGRWPG